MISFMHILVITQLGLYEATALDQRPPETRRRQSQGHRRAGTAGVWSIRDTTAKYLSLGD